MPIALNRIFLFAAVLQVKLQNNPIKVATKNDNKIETKKILMVSIPVAKL